LLPPCLKCPSVAGEPAGAALGRHLSAAWRFSESFQARFSWNRGFTADDQDRDFIL
jgi:hypothetical protein